MPQIDYDTLAQQFGGRATPASSPAGVDYDALARKFGGVDDGEPEGDQVIENLKNIGRTVGDLGIGAAKGVGHTFTGLGKLAHKIPGVTRAVDALYGSPGISGAAFDEADDILAPTNTAQRIGHGAEQIAEFFVPAGAAEKAALAIGARVAPKLPTFALRAVGQSAASGGVAAVQGSDPSMAAFLGAAGPVGGAVAGKVGRVIGDKAVPLVRSALKPTVAEMRRVAGVSGTGLQAEADRLARFVVDNQLTSPDKAQALIAGAESELQALLKAGAAATDAPQRASRYLKALERSAAKQGLGADDVAIIRSKAQELLESSPLSEDVASTVMQPSPSGLLTSSGQPFLVPVQKTSRALRANVPADEALDIARSSSRWSTRKAWGEQKGASLESEKAVERATRDAVKDAVPESRPILRRQGQAIQAKKVLERQAFREGNRDQIGLPTYVTAAGEMAAGGAPKLAFAAQFLRDNQLKLGIWADRLGKAIDSQDVKAASDILARFGAGADAQARRPAYGSSGR